jgi:hypothetical protein
VGAAVLTLVAASGPRALEVFPTDPIGGTVTVVTPTFSWSTSGVPTGGDPVSYRLVIARDALFSVVLFDSTLAGQLTFQLRRPLKPGRMFWRVDARAATGETATTGATGPVALPLWATLTSLSSPSGTTTFEAQPTLTWTPAGIVTPPGPFTYDVFVRRVGAAADAVSAGGLTQTQFVPPTPLERSVSYRWSLVVHAGPDTTLVTSAGAFLVVDPSTPPATLLYQNFPNPFPDAGRDHTCLWFDLAAASLVELDILDLRGALVRRYIPSGDFPAVLPPGRYGRGTVSGGGVCDPRLTWDGRTADGRGLPPGVYLYRLRAAGSVQFKRIVFRGVP